MCEAQLRQVEQAVRIYLCEAAEFPLSKSSSDNALDLISDETKQASKNSDDSLRTVQNRALDDAATTAGPQAFAFRE